MKSKVYALLLCCFFIFTVFFSLSYGTIYIPVSDIVTYFGQLIHGNTTTISSNQDVLQYIRLPHVVLSFIIGMALAVSGAVMQAILKNNLADPYLLGISSGGSLGAVIAIGLGVTAILGANTVGIFAFAGAFILTVILLLFSSISKKQSPLTLLLFGFALNAICSGIISFIISLIHNSSKTQTIQFWLMGQIRTLDWHLTGILGVVVILGVLFFMSQRRILDLMLVGDTLSLTMGRNLSTYRKIYILISSIFVGATVFVAGMIGFVGLVIPHIVRLIWGSSHKLLIPYSAILGGCFLVFADVFGRNVISGTDIPIGISAAICGAPIFLYFLLSSKYGGKKL